MRQNVRHNTPNRSTGSRVPLLLMLLLLGLTSCTFYDYSHLDDMLSEGKNGGGEPTQMYIYVYSPYTPVPTRGYTGQVSPTGTETSVYALQIWVFSHDSHQLIGHFSPTASSALNEPGGYEVFQIAIDETYAQTEESVREHVDVYVLANVTDGNCGLKLDAATTQAELEAALLAHGTTTDAFGLTSPVTGVPENLGLPMSGVLRDQPVTGSAPVLRLDDSGQLATITLIRAVSKLRFAFSRRTDSDELHIKSIRLLTDMIPEEQFLFMAPDAPYDGRTCHIKSDGGYNNETTELLAETITEVAASDDPVIYAWGYDKTQEPQAYEQLIDHAVADGYVTQQLYYLRESDRLLQGEIKYQIGDEEEVRTTTFRMADDGGFSRNHFWTVYAYLADAKLQVVTAKVTPWKQTESDSDFYNW